MVIREDLREKAKRIEQDIEIAMNDINLTERLKCDAIQPSAMQISTISFVAVLNIAKINLDFIYDRFHNERYLKNINTQLATLDRHHATKRCTSNHLFLKDKKKQSFSNSAILKINNYLTNTIAVKIFNNGKLHITGPRTIAELLTVLEITLAVVKVIYGATVFEIDEFHVQMINTNFMIKQRNLNDKAVHDLFFEYSRRPSLHDDFPNSCLTSVGLSDKHPAVQLSMKHYLHYTESEVTVFIFRTGSIIITGSKSGTALWRTYLIMMQILNANIGKVVVSDPREHPVTAPPVQHLPEGAAGDDLLAGMDELSVNPHGRLFLDVAGETQPAPQGIDLDGMLGELMDF